VFTVLPAIDVNGFDDAVLHLFNCQWTSPGFESLLHVLQDKWIAVPVFVGVLVLLSFLDRRKCLRALGAAAVAWGLSMLLASLLWATVDRPRPPWVYERMLRTEAEIATCDTSPEAVAVRRHASGSPGFPSRHALTGGVFAMVLTLAWGWVGIGAWIYALLVAIGRVHDGVHWPTDVLAGLVLGALVGWGVWRVLPNVLGRIGLRRLVETRETGPDSPEGPEPGGALG